MASINSLLNPLPTPSPASSTSIIMLRSPRKKQKMALDAPVFQRGKPRGEMRYPPCEVRDEDLASLHRDFRIFPFRNIADYPKHIPYKSDKKSFQERTGRESLEVFQYTFQLPGEERQWTVMWDYNIGLVRITNLFKCNDYSKTVPARMLKQNPGLCDICHSITGGAIIAQGYWMPYEAAKAVAATFCWKIRFALTPIFGIDFPNLCVPPDDRSRFGQMVISPSIVQIAREKANHYRMLDLRCSSSDSVCTEYRHRPSSAPSGDRGRARVALGRHILPKSHQHRHYRSNTSSTSTDTSVIEYGSSPEGEYYGDSSTEPYYSSLISQIRGAFTPVNTPRSTDICPPSAELFQSTHEVLASLSESTSTSASRSRARARPRARIISSSVPSNQPTTNAISAVAVSDRSDIDADAETDFKYNFDLDPESTSSDDSSRSTLSSGSASSTSITTNGSPRLYPDNDNIDAGMIEFRASKRIAVAARRRERRVHPHPRLAEYERERERGYGHGQIELSRRIHTQNSPNPRASPELTAAHALLTLLQDIPRSDVDAHSDVNIDDRPRHKRVKDDHKNQSHCHGHGNGHGSSNISINPPTPSGQKRRRASA